MSTSHQSPVYINLDLFQSPKSYLKYPDRVRVFLLYRNSAVISTWLNTELIETLIFHPIKIISTVSISLRPKQQ